MFTKKSILLPLLLSLFIYLEYFGLSLKLINTILGLSAFLLIFQLNKQELFISGFFTAILWFWWLGHSFVHYELIYLIPFILLGIGLVYGILFYFIGFFENIFYKIFYIFLLSYIEPFGFNWFKLELPFINSYLGTSKLEFLSLIIISGIFIQYRNRFQQISFLSYVAVVLTLYIYNLNNINPPINQLSLKIFHYNTFIPQEQKWSQQFKTQIIQNNFHAIQNAIDNNYELIILPETAFPVILNHQKYIMETLLNYSKKIAIITGSLYEKNNNIYNSTYLFQNEKIEIAHKVVLVPFGEAVPFPEKIRNLINDTFYNGAKDYLTADSPTTFEINEIKFRNAICYEVTTDDIYKNLDTNYIVAISNNAWFTPSIQPILQKLLMEFYENKYKVDIIAISNQ